MRSHIPSPALQLLRTPLAEPGGDRLARELLELCRYEPDLHISSLHVAVSILRACEGRVVLHRGALELAERALGDSLPHSRTQSR